jgi:hypothetical protein
MMEARFYVARNKQKVGPFSILQLKQMALSENLKPRDMILSDGSARWVPASSLESIFPIVATAVLAKHSFRSSGIASSENPARECGSRQPISWIQKRCAVISHYGLRHWRFSAAFAAGVVVSFFGIAVIPFFSGSRQGEKQAGSAQAAQAEASSGSKVREMEDGSTEKSTFFKAQAEAAKVSQARAEAELARAKSDAQVAKATAEAARAELAMVQIKIKENQKRDTNEDKARVQEEVKRQLEANKRDREDRLAILALRKQNEIRPLEEEVRKIQEQIDTGDRNMKKLRAQQGSLPPSFGVPNGTKFQPAIPREVRDIEMQARERSERLEIEYRRVRVECLEKLRTAKDRLRMKAVELENEHQKIISDS